MIYKTSSRSEIKEILKAMGSCKEVELSIEMEDGVFHIVSGFVSSAKIGYIEAHNPILGGKVIGFEEVEFEIIADLPKQRSVRLHDGQQ